MKIFKTLPTNQEFYNQYATLIPTLKNSGLIAQIISALTEIGVIWTILYLKIYDLLPSLAFTFATIGAILGTAFIEIALRKFIPFSVKAILFKRWKGLELVLSIFILSASIGLIFTSGVLSFKGSKDIIENLSSKPPKISTDSIEQIYNNDINRFLTVFSSDSTTISGRWNNEMEATEKSFDAKISRQWNIYYNWKKRQENDEKSYRTQREKVKSNIAKLKEAKADSLSQIEHKKGNELALLLKSKNNGLKESKTRYLASVDRITNQNDNAIQQAENKINQYGLGLGWFTLICLFVLIIFIAIEEIIKKGAGINEKPQPTQYHFEQSIFGEAMEALKERIEFYFRNKIRSFAANTPPPLIPNSNPVLYEVPVNGQQRIKIEFEDNSQVLSGLKIPRFQSKISDLLEPKTIIKNNPDEIGALPEKALNYFKAFLNLQKSNLAHQAKEMELKGDDVIKCYLGPNHSNNEFQILKSQIIGFLNGGNENPFQQHHRKPAGFKIGEGKHINENLITKTVDAENHRICEHCKSPYQYRHHKQKYCKDECRIKAWELRTGKSLTMKRKKR